MAFANVVSVTVIQVSNVSVIRISTNTESIFKTLCHCFIFSVGTQ